MATYAGARDPDSRSGTLDLAAFLNSSRVEPTNKGPGAGHQPIMVANAAGGEAGPGAQPTGPPLVKCGPLLNYQRMENETWFGSVLIVVQGGSGIAHPEGEVIPELSLRGAVAAGAAVPQTEIPEFRSAGVKLYSDPVNTFWRFKLVVPMQAVELRCEYTITGAVFGEGKQPGTQAFYVPSATESMRIMFHSCNGFSVGTDEADYSGPCLWNDVSRVHANTPFHVMIGGGDQIYNDGIRVHGPLRAWTDVSNPKKRREYLFPESLRVACDEYYVNNYLRWYSMEPFASANGKIPQVNIWDDHDIIDGFGSYVDEFMHCPVFKGIGGVAQKYYLLFQHHLAPPAVTFVSDLPAGTTPDDIQDSRQIVDTYVLKEDEIDPSYIIGSKPGPYVVGHSRSIYARLGARIAFFGIDARTERTRKQVNFPETYEVIFARLRKELTDATAAGTPIQHLVVLLGIPIAYPRLTWLENIFSSPIMGPMKFLNKRFGFGGSFFNDFDGSVDLLDDLDDHYTARTHKKERLFIVQAFQTLAAEFSVRVSILGGDVHLAAVGRFYSNPKLKIPIRQDHRYMANIISSAIVNKPPPKAVADLLARRNKLHHLDEHTDETLMKFFDKDPGTKAKTANSNHVTMPSRNWAMITENRRMDGSASPLPVPQEPVAADGDVETTAADPPMESHEPLEEVPPAKDGHSWLHHGEVNAGTQHRAADAEQHGKDTDGSLDVAIRVEIDQHDPEGRTQAYGMTIPRLLYQAVEKSVVA